MKKKLPRPAKIALYLLVAAVTALLYWAVLGYPPVSYSQLRRQLERDALVGPGTVIDVLEREEYDEFTKLHVGKTEHGFLFYRDSVYGSGVTYFEKTGAATIVPAPTSWQNWKDKAADEHLPIYVFDAYPDAVRAELELTVVAVPDHTYDDDFRQHYSLEADREADGFFLFHLYVTSGGEALGMNGYIPQFFSELLHEPDRFKESDYAEATVRFYGKDGALIAEETRTLRNAIGTVHAE